MIVFIPLLLLQSKVFQTTVTVTAENTLYYAEHPSSQRTLAAQY
jgi:hypothetical protein